MARQARSTLGRLFKALLYLVAAWVLGFGYFFITMPHKGIHVDDRADAIIVLTGGAGRLEAGLTLLEAKVAKRLLISGVNPVVKPGELSALTGAERELFTCCVDLGKVAMNTEGNALEGADWANQNGFARIVLVTADYHMPRSLVLFREAMPDAVIIAHPVGGEWPLLYLAKEYSKYVITLLRHAASA